MTSKRYKEWAARTRVPLGFLMLAVYAVAARPTVWLLAAGGGVAWLGLLLRAWACGHLDKNRALATGGPYAYVRNPLYLGTAIVAAGFAIAGGVWWIAGLFAAFLLLVYLPVVQEEEAHLAALFPEYQGYAARVPRYWPSWRKPRDVQRGEQRYRMRLYWQNQEYNALVGYLFGLALLFWKLTTS
jgi:protein-S-isoprenylcysteine O-methyltransferase Ste14